MDIYISVKDVDDEESSTAVLGAFTTEDLARAACQADSDDDSGMLATSSVPLQWTDDSAEIHRTLGYSAKYTVRLVNLDEPTYA
jgi:hypothetical protein